ncbi:MAG: outer membrane beta-barrel protein [Verrucomicrobiales bacterium]|nr:outer membrane beta-barrel protein [Verrucomicrobiales bacterium]
MKTNRKSRLSIAALFSTAFLFSPVFAGDYYPPAKQVQYSEPVDTGYYFEGFGGMLFLEDINGSGAANVTAGFDTGWMAGGTLGYQFAPGLSIEIEGATGEADLDSYAVNGTNFAYSGDLNYSQIAVNMIYEFRPNRIFSPYVGFGIGAGFAEADFVSPGFRIDDDDAAFLYQFIGGARLKINTNSSFFAEYRYGSLGELSLQGSGGGVTFDELQSHQAVIGFQFNF